MGIFGIPFGVSGPRPLQEAKVFSARTVSAGFCHQSARFDKNVFNARMSQRLCRETELKCSVSEFVSRPCRAGETALKGLLSESTSRLPCADETELKNLVSKRAEASRWVRATSSESEGITGLRRVSKSRFDSVFAPSINSSMGVDLSACARVAAALPVAASASCVSTSPALRLHMRLSHPCILIRGRTRFIIQGVLVVCCLCANPPVIPWGLVVRVQGEGGVPKVWFPVRPKICVLSQRWKQE